MNKFQTFTAALMQQNDQPNVTYNALFELADKLIGAILFTLTAIDYERRQAQRIFTNMPKAYPILGTKPMHEDAWSEQVLTRHQTFVANSIEAISDVFPDFALIHSLGCESVINIPIVVHGRVLGTINCLHEAGHYSPEKLTASDELKIPGAAAFLFSNSNLSQGDT